MNHTSLKLRMTGKQVLIATLLSIASYNVSSAMETKVVDSILHKTTVSTLLTLIEKKEELSKKLVNMQQKLNSSTEALLVFASYLKTYEMNVAIINKLIKEIMNFTEEDTFYEKIKNFSKQEKATIENAQSFIEKCLPISHASQIIQQKAKLFDLQHETANSSSQEDKEKMGKNTIELVESYKNIVNDLENIKFKK